MDIIDTLNEKREMVGVSVTDLAGACGVSRVQMSLYLNKKTKIPFNIVSAILDQLGYDFLIVVKM